MQSEEIEVPVNVTLVPTVQASVWQILKWRLFFGKRRHEIIDKMLENMQMRVDDQSKEDVTKLTEEDL